MRLMWLVEAALATGYPVVVVDGWETRGYSTDYDPHVVVTHHTAGPTDGGDMPSLGIIVNGRVDVPGPLSNYGVGRSGTIYVVASGKSNNAGEGQWTVGGVTYDSNYDTVGIEPENNGSQPWPAAQIDSIQRLEAQILYRLGHPAAYLCGHKEWALPPGRKVDPHTIVMSARRAAVAILIEEIDMPTAEEIAAATYAKFAASAPLTIKLVDGTETNGAFLQRKVLKERAQGEVEEGSARKLLDFIDARTDTGGAIQTKLDQALSELAVMNGTLVEIGAIVEQIDFADNTSVLAGVNAIRVAMGSAAP